jgi:hypothetical protein
MFYYVEFLKTMRTGRQEVMRRAILDPGANEVRFEGIPQYWMESMQQRGIQIWEGQRLFPHEGLRFLRGLKVQYTGSMIRATDVQEAASLPELPAEPGLPFDRQGTDMFRMVNGKKEDADLWDAILGDDKLPSDTVLGEDAPGPRKPPR